MREDSLPAHYFNNIYLTFIWQLFRDKVKNVETFGLSTAPFVPDTRIINYILLSDIHAIKSFRTRKKFHEFLSPFVRVLLYSIFAIILCPFNMQISRCIRHHYKVMIEYCEFLAKKISVKNGIRECQCNWH